MKRHISKLTRQLILAELNGCLPRSLMRANVHALFPWVDAGSVTTAIHELVAAGLARVEYGKRELRRRVLMEWARSGRALWEAALPILFSPVRETRLTALPENPNDFTLAGESLLAVRSPWYVLHARPCLACKDASTSANRERIRPMHFRHAECAIQFWHYPPILPGLEYIDNLSLYLTLKDVRDPAADLYGWFLVESHGWAGVNNPQRRQTFIADSLT